MKPFVFSLQTLFKHTADQEEAQKKILASIQQRLLLIDDAIQAVELQMSAHCHDFQRKMAVGSGAVDLQQFNIGFASLREEQLQLLNQRKEITKEKDDCQTVLMRLMREIKALEKLRDKQFEAYKIELAHEEEKQVDEIVSFRQGQSLVMRGLS